jgi:hypothetical protein
VAFEQPSVQAEASGQLGSLRWETLEDDGIKVAGRLTFTVSDNVLRATRDGPRELSGEAELVDNLIDAVDDFGRSRCADKQVQAMEAAVPEVFAAQEAQLAAEAVAPVVEAPVAAAPEVAPAAPKKRRRAVAKKTGAAPSAAPAPVPAPAPAAPAPPAVEAAPAEVKAAVDAAAAAAQAQAAAKAPAPPAGAAKKKKRRSAVKSRTKKGGSS